jgi:2-(1,2-epoxy-1,2-dihydrophenyl)acetyl-CoA isomerase
MAEKPVDVSRDGAVQIIRFVNEKSRNSLTADMRDQLRDAMKLAGSDPGVRAVYITGKGAAFCAGGDFNMLKAQRGPWDTHARFRNFGEWFLPMLQFEKPVVVGINGFAVGGGLGLALAGDIVIAAESAKLVAGYFRLGVVPDIGMMYTLPRLVGLSRAKKILFGNETLSAREACDIGLIAGVVPDAELDDHCMKRAQEMAKGPARIMGLAKLIMARSFETGLHDMYLYEDLGQSLAQSTAEFQEGLASMMERRPADFLGADAKADAEPDRK